MFMANTFPGFFYSKKYSKFIPLLILLSLGILGFFQPTHIQLAAGAMGAQWNLHCKFELRHLTIYPKI